MDGSEPSRAWRIAAIRLNVADLDRAVAFYVAVLGFAIEAHGEGVTTLSLGGAQLELAQAPPDVAPYPVSPLANDPWFQHFAIRVSDMPAAFARSNSQQATPISIGGPQQLPPSTGSVIAYKFRDPDGHPLELSYAPGTPAPPGKSPFVTIDHSAIAVRDIDLSLDFWSGQLGLTETARLLNEGPTQWRLDGLDGALVDIVVLELPGGGPHLELLHYREPRSGKPPLSFNPRDIAATSLRLCAVDSASGAVTVPLADPDGHLVERSS